MAENTPKYQPFDISRDAKGNYHFLGPQNEWQPLTSEMVGGPVDDEVARQFRDGMRQATAAEARAKPGERFEVKVPPAVLGQEPGSMFEVAPDNVFGSMPARTKPNDPRNLLTRIKDQLLHGSQDTGAVATPGPLSLSPLAGLLEAIGPKAMQGDVRGVAKEIAPAVVAAAANRVPGAGNLARLVRSPVGSSALAAGSQAALDPSDIGSPALTFAAGTIPAGISQASKAFRAPPVEEIKRYERGLISSAGKSIEEHLPGQRRGLNIPSKAQPPGHTFAPGEEASDVLRRLQGGPRINAQQELKDIFETADFYGDKAFFRSIPPGVASLDPQSGTLIGGVATVDQLDLIRRNLTMRANDLLRGNQPHSPMAAKYKEMAKAIEDRIIEQAPEYRKYLDAYHRQEATGRLVETLRSNDPVGEFEKTIGQGAIRRPDGSYLREPGSLDASAFTQQERRDIRDIMSRMKMAQDKLLKVMNPDNSLTTTVGTITGALTGAPLGKAWLGGHIGRDVSQLMGSWLSNADTRRLMQVGINRGLMDQSGFWIALSMAARGATGAANQIVSQLPDDPEYAKLFQGDQRDAASAPVAR